MNYFGNKVDDEFKFTFAQVANIKGDSVDFNIVSDPECAEEFQIEPKSIAIFKYQESILYKGSSDRQEFLDWFTFISQPKMIHLTQDILQYLYTKQMPFLVLFRKKQEANEDYAKEFEKAAEQLFKRVSVGYIDMTEQAHQIVANMMRLYKEEDLPVIMATIPSASIKFKFKDNTQEIRSFKADDLVEWMKGIEEEKIDPHIISEDAYPQVDGPVQTLVGSQFLDTIKDNNKSVVLLSFNSYVMTETEIANVKKTFLSVATDIGMSDKLQFLQVDYGLNDLVGVSLNNFPDFMIFPKNNQPTFEFAKELTENNLMEWIDGIASSIEIAADERKMDL